MFWDEKLPMSDWQSLHSMGPEWTDRALQQHCYGQTKQQELWESDGDPKDVDVNLLGFA
jgi:hypothetical protein